MAAAPDLTLTEPWTDSGCKLCGLAADDEFCCLGCRNVHAILVESGIAQPGVDLRQTDLFRRSLALGLVSNGERGKNQQAPAIPSGAPVQERVFHVGGMWCVSCAWLIEHTLGGDPAVQSAEVLFTSDLLKLRYYPQYLPPGRIEHLVGVLGYRLSEYDAERASGDPERRSLLLRLGIAACLWINVMMLNLSVFFGYFDHLEGSLRRILPFIVMTLATPVVFYSAYPILRLALLGVRQRVIRMETLLALGIVSAYGYSTVAAFRGGTHLYFDIACAIVTLVLLGKFLERGAKENAARSIATLHRMLPKKARLLTAGRERFVAIEALHQQDVFLVKAGERIPADGVVVEGESHVDESIVTGESLPSGKQVGSNVLGGSLNISGVLSCRATTLGEDSTLARIVRAVEHALSARSGIERAVDRVSRMFVPAVIAIAVLVGVAAYLYGVPAGESIMRAVTVLVIACPCALGIATPLALTAAVGAASRSGILIRDTRVLETAGTINAVVFDKTGTVTRGDFSLLECDNTHLPVVAALEAYSEHPLGRAVVQAARLQSSAFPAAAGVEVIKGLGMRGVVEGKNVFIGSRLFAGLNTSRDLPGDSADARTIVYYGWDGAVRGRMVFGDTLRGEAAETVAGLQQRGIRVFLASGDAAGTALAVGATIGADESVGELAPAQKLQKIEVMRRGGSRVAMVGDGVNDAPALAAADLGIAMGCGTDIAMTAASVVLMTSDLRRVTQTFDIAEQTLRVIRQNLFWAFFYNVAGITLAAAGVLNPIVAAAAMITSSLFVIGNSLRLERALSPRPGGPSQD